MDPDSLSLQTPQQCLTCRMISLAASVTDPSEDMRDVAKTYVPMTMTLLSDKAKPDCTKNNFSVLRHWNSGHS